MIRRLLFDLAAGGAAGLGAFLGFAVPATLVAWFI